MQALYSVHNTSFIENWITQAESERFDILFAIKAHFNNRMRWWVNIKFNFVYWIFDDDHDDIFFRIFSFFTEKEELVNLVLIHVDNSTNFSPDSQSTPTSFSNMGTDQSDDARSNPFDHIRNTCQNLFSTFTEKIATGQFKFFDSFEKKLLSSEINEQCRFFYFF